MDIDPNRETSRKHLIDILNSSGEKGRKYESFKQWEIYQDRIKDYVINELKEQFDADSVLEIPIQSSINLSKRIVNQCGSIYSKPPEREFLNVSDEQAEALEKNYKAMGVDRKLNTSNKGYELQDQSHLWIIPKNGKLVLRILKSHQVTVIPDDNDPEVAAAYMITSFNKEDFVDQDNEGTATGYQGRVDQFQSSKQFQEKFGAINHDASKNIIVWTREHNFSMDIKGNLTSEINDNPLKEFGLMPFVDISRDKEFEYWVRQGTGVTDFTVQFNARLSEVAQVVKMQGFAQAILKGPEEMLASNIKVGPTYIVKLLVDKARQIDGDFSFANPDSDIQGSIQWIESLLSLFLSSRGIDPKTITAKGETTTFSSGLERLLSMIEKMSASQESYDVYKNAESDLYKIVLAWLEVLETTDGIEQELKIGTVPNDTKVVVNFHSPEMIQSQIEKLTNTEKEIEIGLNSTINAIMEREEVSREEAEIKFTQYQDDESRKFEVERQDEKDNIFIRGNETDS